MWNLVRRAINRFLAAHFIKVAGWFFLRYASVGFLLTLFFIIILVVKKHLPQQLLEVAFGSALAVPFLLAGVCFLIFCWALTARAIEPAKPSDTLQWSEDEMAPWPVQEPDAEVFELYPEGRGDAA